MNDSVSEQRRRNLQRLAAEPLDLLVVGGGIVGAGVARDAAMRGLRVGLVDQQDVAFGTSSRSSRLLHGGLRYLAQGRLGLVREASVEKTILHRIAPHLAQPLPFLFPAYRDNPEWVLWQLKLGVKIYDLMCRGRNLGQSEWLSREEALHRIPGLLSDQLSGAVRYYDGLTNDARLTIDTLRSAARHQAVIVNYCRFTGASRGNDWECGVVDQLEQNELKVRASAVVNATGPWAPELPHSRVKLRLTKGIHLVIERTRLPVPNAVVMTEGKRILFAIPWGERAILGTTDTDYTGLPGQVKAESQDVRYLLRVTNRFFPEAHLRESDLVSVWAGLRPLIADGDGAPSDISRSHEIRMGEPGWWDIAGGKLTTHRLMAEQTLDQIVNFLRGLRRLNGSAGVCRTAEEPLLPEAETRGLSGIVPPEISREAVEHFCTREWACHLDDVMVRRASWKQYFKDASAPTEQVAEWMAERLGWNAARRAEEIERCALGCD